MRRAVHRPAAVRVHAAVLAQPPPNGSLPHLLHLVLQLHHLRQERVAPPRLQLLPRLALRQLILQREHGAPQLRHGFQPARQLFLLALLDGPERVRHVGVRAFAPPEPDDGLVQLLDLDEEGVVAVRGVDGVHLRVWQVLRELRLKLKRVQHVAGDAHDERPVRQPPEHLEVLAPVPRDVVRIQGVGELDVAVRVKAPDELLPLVLEIGFNLEVREGLRAFVRVGHGV